MIAGLDNCCCTNLLVRQHGEEADLEAAQCADHMVDKGDMDGRRLWLRILGKVKELNRA